MDVVRIAMWSGPRNISTAMMYSFGNRDDTVCVDEPLYAHYLASTGLRHPGYRDVLESQDRNAELVLETMLYGPHPRPIVFFKNMAHHMIGIDLARFDGLTNVLLTRDPHEMLVSLTREIPDADVDATGDADVATGDTAAERERLHLVHRGHVDGLHPVRHRAGLAAVDVGVGADRSLSDGRDDRHLDRTGDADGAAAGSDRESDEVLLRERLDDEAADRPVGGRRSVVHAGEVGADRRVNLRQRLDPAVNIADGVDPLRIGGRRHAAA